MSQSDNIKSALRTITFERKGLDAVHDALSNGMGEAFETACNIMRDIGGRVIVTGVGKSGHIGTKIAATLASTGTPAFLRPVLMALHQPLQPQCKWQLGMHLR